MGTRLGTISLGGGQRVIEIIATRRNFRPDPRQRHGSCRSSGAGSWTGMKNNGRAHSGCAQNIGHQTVRMIARTGEGKSRLPVATCCARHCMRRRILLGRTGEPKSSRFSQDFALGNRSDRNACACKAWPENNSRMLSGRGRGLAGEFRQQVLASRH